MATKSIQKNTIIKRADAIKTQVKRINDEVLNTSDVLVEEAIVTGEQWQRIFAKAMKSSTVLMGKQNDLLFDTLEALKGQFTDGGGRLKGLLSLNWRKSIELKTRVGGSKKKEVTKAVKTRAKAAKKVVAKKVTTQKAKVAAAKKSLVKKSTAVVLDDLTKIEGIGPKVAEHFNKAGITTFTQMADSDVKSLKAVLATAGSRFKMCNPSTWSKQAKLAANGKWTQLKTLQAKLKGGVKASK